MATRTSRRPASCWDVEESRVAGGRPRPMKTPLSRVMTEGEVPPGRGPVQSDKLSHAHQDDQRRAGTSKGAKWLEADLDR